jgi:hypothetical protein
MKKLLLSLAIFSLALTSQAQKFYTVDAQLVVSSLTAHTHIQSDTVVVDSTSMQINCWFGQVGNPYIKGHDWTQFVQIKATVRGSYSQSMILNGAWKFAEAYRKRVYPDVR